MKNKKFQNFIALINKLEPDASFFASSKVAIISSSQKTKGFLFSRQLFEGIEVKTAFAFASIFLVALIAGISYFVTPSSQLANSLNDTTLVAEAIEANLQVEIAEAAYFDESAEKVAIALDKIAGTKKTINND